MHAVVFDALADIDAVLDEADALLPESAPQTWVHLLSGLVDLNLGALTDALGSHFGERLPAEITRAQHDTLARLDGMLRELAARETVRADLTALHLVAAIAIITRPQAAAIHAAAPGLVEQPLAAFDHWCRTYDLRHRALRQRPQPLS